MRWDELFNDIEGQFAEAGRLSLDAEINDRARTEMVDLDLAARLRGSFGCLLTIHLRNGDSVQGALRHAGADALVLDADRHQVLVPYAAAVRYVGLGRHSMVEQSPVRRGIGLAHALRGLLRDRAEVSVTLGENSGAVRLDGVIDRVGKDYLDLASLTPGETRRSGRINQVSTVPFNSLVLIRSLSLDRL